MTKRIKQVVEIARSIWVHPHNRHRRTVALARFVCWQLWERIVKRPWLVPLVGNRTIKCYPHSHSAANVIYFGFAEWREMPFVLHFLRAGDVFVDVGANVGVYSLIASSVPGVAIIAMEPGMLAYRRLIENLQLNGVHDARVYQAAAGEMDGHAFLTTEFDTTNRLVRPGVESPRVEKVLVRSIDSLFEETALERVAIMKIDVEGHEAAVIAGAKAVISASRPTLIVEYNDRARVRALLGDLGYGLYEYDPGQRILRALADEAIPQNVIAIYDLPAATARLKTDA